MRITAGGQRAGDSSRRGEHRGGDIAWQARTRARWLRVTGESGEIRAAPIVNLEPGLYGDTVYFLDAASALAALPVSMYVASGGIRQTVATELLGLGSRGRVRPDLQASYGWDPLGMRPRPPCSRFARARIRRRSCVCRRRSTHRSPTATTRTHPCPRAAQHLYYVSPSGDAELVVGTSVVPAYGLTELPDGDLLVAEWSGRILRVNLDTRGVSTYTELPARICQIASDGTGVVYAATTTATFTIEPNGVYAVIPWASVSGGSLRWP